MLRLLAEHEGHRYYLLLVDTIDTVTEWLPGPEHFSLFLYQNEMLTGYKSTQMDPFAQSAILAGAECVWCGGLMGSILEDVFIDTLVALESGPDGLKTLGIFSEEHPFYTSFDMYSDFDAQVWKFMNVSDSDLHDRVAVFRKDDLTWKRYKKSLKAWINGDLQLGEYSEETNDLGIEGGYTMGDYGKVATLENEVEAQVLSSMLDEVGIDYAIRTYHDTAYNGIFQMQKGWGIVEADLDNRDEILEILNSLRAGEPTGPDETGETNETEQDQ